jgi:DNA replication regulator DPB11
MHESTSDRVPTQAPSAHDEEEEIACVAHRPAMTVQIWGSLLKNRGYEISNGKVIKSPSKVQKSLRAEPAELEDMDVDAPKAKSIISRFRRENSFAPVNEPSQKTQPSQRLQPFRRTTSASKPQVVPIVKNANAQAGPSTIGPRGIFSGLKFRVLGEARSASVRSAIEQRGGIWVSEDDTDEVVDYVIVRLVRYATCSLFL